MKQRRATPITDEARAILTAPARTVEPGPHVPRGRTRVDSLSQTRAHRRADDLRAR